MPLIACPDCNAQISDAAPACPQCGRPRAVATPAHVVPATNHGKTLVAIGTVLVLVGFICAFTSSGLVGCAMMFVGFVVFVIGRVSV